MVYIDEIISYNLYEIEFFLISSFTIFQIVLRR